MSVQLTAIDANWRHKNGTQEASIDLKPPLLIVLYPLYYLVIELLSQENECTNSIESKRRSYSPTNSEQKIPYISAEEASIDLKHSLTIALSN